MVLCCRRAKSIISCRTKVMDDVQFLRKFIFGQIWMGLTPKFCVLAANLLGNIYICSALYFDKKLRAEIKNETEKIVRSETSSYIYKYGYVSFLFSILFYLVVVPTSFLFSALFFFLKINYVVS